MEHGLRIWVETHFEHIIIVWGDAKTTDKTVNIQVQFLAASHRHTFEDGLAVDSEEVGLQNNQSIN